MTSKRLLIYFVLMFIDVFSLSAEQIELDRTKAEMKTLSRRKRFLIFPTGSSFSVAVCMTVGVYGNPQFSIFSWALNYGFAYNLPTNSTYFTNVPEDVFNFPFKDLDPPTTTTVAPEILPIDHHEEVSWSSSGPPPEPAERKYFVYNQPKYETKPMLQRRYRRDIYRNIEGVIDKMGYNGRDCILQALCESPQIFNTKRQTMVQKFIQTVFSFPKSKVLSFEHPELMIYDEAHRKGRSKFNCGINSRCGFSLIKMALGKYSKDLISFM